MMQSLLAAFVDISPEETSLNTPFSSVEDENNTSSSKDVHFAKEVSSSKDVQFAKEVSFYH